MPETVRPPDRRARWGGVLLVVGTLQYALAQIVTAAAWTTPYSLSRNYISDLGVTVCGTVHLPHGGTEQVCSPWHAVMNASFILSGVLLVAAMILLCSYWPPGPAARIGVVLLIIAGAGKVLTGLYPENTQLSLHLLGALNIPLGELGILLLSIALIRHRDTAAAAPVGVAGVVLAGIGLIASVLSSAAQTAGPALLLGLGAGAMERLAGYPANVWLLIVGLVVITQRDTDRADSSAPSASLQRR